MSGFHQQPQYGNNAPPQQYGGNQGVAFYSQQPGDMGGGGGGQPGQPNFLGGISPEMLNMGLSAGKNMLSAQRDQWLPGLSTFFSALKIYFAVSSSYVVKKLSVIAIPFRNQKWNRLQADESYGQGDKGISSDHKWAAPKYDHNAPDLYIPLMAFLTYLLLVGVARGATSTFTPEFLTQTLWRCLALQMFECLLIKLGLSVMNVSLPFLDLVSYTGYKYVGLSVNVVVLVLGSTIYFICSLYAAASLAFFVLKTMAAVVPQPVGRGPPRHLMLLGFAGLQFLVVILLSWL